MRRYLIVCLFLCYAVSAWGRDQVPQRIVVWGADINPKMVGYVVELTGKPAPRICYLPTASADNEANITYWNGLCKALQIEPFVLKVWVSSDLSNPQPSFEERLLGMDAIVVGGGNTLNMLGIWDYQQIDKALRKALDRGIILAGGSAGSICWFLDGVSDARPEKLSLVDGLGFLPFSHCPHYQQESRKELYQQSVASKRMKPGYACDDLAGIYFRDGRVADVFSVDDVNKAYYVSLEKGKVVEQALDARILIAKNALSEAEYTKTLVGKKSVQELCADSLAGTPLGVHVATQQVLAEGRMTAYRKLAAACLQQSLADVPDKAVDSVRRERIRSTPVISVLQCGDKLAAVITEGQGYYGVWYFYYEKGRWCCAGEDFGGYTQLEAEISFREKARTHLGKVVS